MLFISCKQQITYRPIKYKTMFRYEIVVVVNLDIVVKSREKEVSGSKEIAKPEAACLTSKKPVGLVVCHAGC